MIAEIRHLLETVKIEAEPLPNDMHPQGAWMIGMLDAKQAFYAILETVEQGKMAENPPQLYTHDVSPIYEYLKCSFGIRVGDQWRNCPSSVIGIYDKLAYCEFHKVDAIVSDVKGPEGV